MKLTIDIDCSVIKPKSKKNSMIIKRRKLIKSQAVLLWEQELTEQALKACAEQQWNVLEGKPIALRMDVTFPDHKRRDAHNLIDTVADALEGIVYKNDDQIVHMVITKQIVKGQYRVLISIEDLQGP